MCDSAFLRASQKGLQAEKLSAFLLDVQRKVLSSGRWQAAAAFAHAIGAAAVMQARRLQDNSTRESVEEVLSAVTFLWTGDEGAKDLGSDKAFLGLCGFLSFGADANGACSPFVTAITQAAQLSLRLLTGEVTLQEFYTEVSTHVSSASMEILLSAEDQLQHALEEPLLIVDRVPRQTSADSKADLARLQKTAEVIRSSQKMLEAALPKLVETKAGLLRLINFLDKARRLLAALASEENLAECALLHIMARMKERSAWLSAAVGSAPSGRATPGSLEQIQSTVNVLRALAALQISYHYFAFGSKFAPRASPNRPSRQSLESKLQEAGKQIEIATHELCSCAIGAETAESGMTDKPSLAELLHLLQDMLTKDELEEREAQLLQRLNEVDFKKLSATISASMVDMASNLAEQPDKDPQREAHSGSSEVHRLITMLTHRTTAAHAALKALVLDVEKVEGDIQAALPDLKVAGAAAVSKALLAAKQAGAAAVSNTLLAAKQTTEVEPVGGELEAWLSSLRRLFGQTADNAARHRILLNVRSVREALSPERQKPAVDEGGGQSAPAGRRNSQVVGEMTALASKAELKEQTTEAREEMEKAVHGLRLHVVSELAKEAKAAMEEAADAAGEVLDEAELGDGLGQSFATGIALVGSLMALGSDASLSDQARCARTREVAAASTLRLRRTLRLAPQAEAGPLITSVTEELVSRHIQEPDKRVKELLGCKDRGPNEAELAHAWETQQKQIKQVMQVQLKELDAKSARVAEMTDPFEKQLALNECRAQRRALAAAAKGCSDVGKKIDVVIDFLVGFQEELAGISSKLDAVQGSVAALHESLERKLGRPVLEVLQDHIEREEQMSRQELEDKVYIATQGLITNERGSFEVGPNNPPFELLSRDIKATPYGLVSFLTEEVDVTPKESVAPSLAAGDGAPDGVTSPEAGQSPAASGAQAQLPVAAPAAAPVEDFSCSPPEKKEMKARQSCRLITGAAGSGKSTFLKKLLAFLRTVYRAMRMGQNRYLQQVVILLVPLGSLVNPMTDLWAEGLKRQYALTPTQCDELREHVRQGRAEVLFLLDAYECAHPHLNSVSSEPQTDSNQTHSHTPSVTYQLLSPFLFGSELGAGYIGKSLYQANNLEQYRSNAERKDNSHSNPVVIYTCRSETLDVVKGGAAVYERWFLPMEPDNEEMDSERAARPYFSQVRIAKFDEKVNEYFAAHAALELRKAFERRVGAMPPSPREIEPDAQAFQDVFGGGEDLANQLLAAYRTATVSAQQAATDAEQEKVGDQGGQKAPARTDPALTFQIQMASKLFATLSKDAGAAATNESLAMICLLATLRAASYARVRFEGSAEASQMARAGFLRDVGQAEDPSEQGESSFPNAKHVGEEAPTWRLVLEWWAELPKPKLIALASQSGQGTELWSFSQYREAYEAIPELKELVSTPFMQQIIVAILHNLAAAASPAEPALKSELLALFGNEAVTNACWAQLRSSKGEGDAALLPSGLAELRKALDEPSHKDGYRNMHDRLQRRAVAAHTRLTRRGDEACKDAEGKKLTAEGLLQVLLRVLARKPVRRFFIYEMWTRMWCVLLPNEYGCPGTASHVSRQSDASVVFLWQDPARGRQGHWPWCWRGAGRSGGGGVGAKPVACASDDC